MGPTVGGPCDTRQAALDARYAFHLERFVKPGPPKAPRLPALVPINPRCQQTRGAQARVHCSPLRRPPTPRTLPREPPLTEADLDQTSPDAPLYGQRRLPITPCPWRSPHLDRHSRTHVHARDTGARAHSPAPQPHCGLPNKCFSIRCGPAQLLPVPRRHHACESPLNVLSFIKAQDKMVSNHVRYVLVKLPKMTYEYVVL